MTSDKRAFAVSPPTQRQATFLSWTKDVLIYTIVLNLFVEFNPTMVIDSFTISILTAMLLKILLEIILGFEHRVAEFFKARPGRLSAVLRILSVWLILFLSKFVILEVVDLVFGDHVDLGKFVDVILLVLALMVARGLFQRAYLALGERAPAAS